MFDSDCSHTDHVKEKSSLGAEGSEFDRCAPYMYKNRKNIKICRAVFCVVCLLINPEESNHRFVSIHLKSQYYLESPRRRRRDQVYM